jgi:gluconokinase
VASQTVTKDGNTAIIVMGVCGVGKSSIGKTLAERIGAHYVEADDFHPIENVRTMGRGDPLSDEMRKPWLEGIGAAVEIKRQEHDVVVACSALKRSYRDLLRTFVGKTQIVFLTGEKQVIADRLNKRTDHFMSPTLLDSQIQDLEIPTIEENPITIDVQGTKHDVDNRVEHAVLNNFKQQSE